MPVPDWSEVEWFVYALEGHGGEVSCRITPRELSPGELVRAGNGETLVATVKRCSLKTVRAFLKRGVPPLQLQAEVDAAAARQAARSAAAPNTYRDFCARLKKPRERAA